MRTYLAQLPEDEGEAGYERMLASLSSPPVVEGAQPQQIIDPRRRLCCRKSQDSPSKTSWGWLPPARSNSNANP